MKGNRLVRSHIFALAMLVTAAALAHENYTAYNLGPGVGPQGINNAGVVVGYRYTTNGNKRAFSYSDGVMTDLGTLGGTESWAYGINDKDTVVGWSTTSNGNYRAFCYSNGVMADLGTLGGNSVASGINRAGVIVGWSYTSYGSQHAFCYINGVMTDLGTLWGTSSLAYGINDTGTIVGESLVYGGDHAFSYSNGVMTDLGTMGGNLSWANAINNAGTIVGMSDTSSHDGHAFSYSNGVMTDVGSLGGLFCSATAINSAGTIVGYGYTSDGGASVFHAFSYSDGVMTDLAPFLAGIGMPGISSADAINDQGAIAGAGSDGSNYMHGFLLVSNPAPVLRVSLSNGPPQLQIEGDVGNRYAVECATSLGVNNQWESFATNTLTTNPQYFTDTAASSSTNRFYRARLVP